MVLFLCVMTSKKKYVVVIFTIRFFIFIEVSQCTIVLMLVSFIDHSNTILTTSAHLYPQGPLQNHCPVSSVL